MAGSISGLKREAEEELEESEPREEWEAFEGFYLIEERT